MRRSNIANQSPLDSSKAVNEPVDRLAWNMKWLMTHTRRFFNRHSGDGHLPMTSDAEAFGSVYVAIRVPRVVASRNSVIRWLNQSVSLRLLIRFQLATTGSSMSQIA
jgi:hypothetical protein